MQPRACLRHTDSSQLCLSTISLWTRLLKAYCNGHKQVSVNFCVVLKGQRIIVPSALRQQVLTNLHKLHQGIARTKGHARQIVYWLKLTVDIERIVRGCSREHQASQPHEPLMNDHSATYPFRSTRVDLFSCARVGNFSRTSIASQDGRALYALVARRHLMMLLSTCNICSLTLVLCPNW